MSASPSSLMAGPDGAPALQPVNLPDLTPPQLSALLVASPPQLLVDCGGLLLPHPLGVCRFVAQLLQLRLRGTSIWLCNVHPELRRYLHELRLSAAFHLNEPALPAGASAQAGRASLT